ncbi:MAG: TAT-variant-translocated molybdopterin oxidoreductase [Bacteroidetes bacterium]|jgi:molybdopterin-containing oxidoreductase family iron-sulfur binding subunit|nr:TAT-variant-translocated molybdopterin oxidoreductase [Bacteroidota bacterium]
MKDYWRSLEELDIDSKTKKEPEPEFPIDGLSEDEIQKSGKTSRRDFMKMLGFGVGFVTLAASCENPINKAIPYLIKPENIIPGNANYYASTFFDGYDYCSVVVKTREGRPIKIEGNDLCPITKGGTNARVQASVLSLYDNYRIKNPLKNKQEITWEEIDTEIVGTLDEIAKKNSRIVILSSTVISPSTKSIFEDFKRKYPTSEIINYDSVSASGIIEANQQNFGLSNLPSYNFDKADLIVSFGADFLGNWISPIEYTKQYSKNRKLSKTNLKMSKHVQFESTLTLTGSNADFRIPINPSQEAGAILSLYNYIAKKAGKATVLAPKSTVNVESLADELWYAKGKSLVVSGSNDTNIQLVINDINSMLGNYGITINIDQPVYIRQGIDSEMDNLTTRMNKGEIGALLMYNVNPAYDYQNSEAFTAALSKTKLSVSFSNTLDETAKLATYVCPDNHYLESWNDSEFKRDFFSLTQPTINKLFNTRQAQESLITWSGNIEPNAENTVKKDVYYSYIKKYWESNLFSKQSKYILFTEFWNNTLQAGVFSSSNSSSENNNPTVVNYSSGNISYCASKLKSTDAGERAIEFVLYESIGLGDGKQANNPWLQELPDPISKVCWDNYLAVSKTFADKNHLSLGDIVIVDDLFELPILVQPGQAENTVAIALGFGRSNAGKVANAVGQNAFRLVRGDGTRKYNGNDIKLVPTGENYILALTQTHHTMHGRNHVHTTVLEKYKNNPSAGNEEHVEAEKHKQSLYNEREFKGHHWALAIDLNSCTGCSACVIACQAENNVAVIGRDEVRNKRIMHWMRIDRYYAEKAEEPEVFFHPVMCQHCDNAPCENVCPVAATQNSKEGLNDMAYNRCIGTRYCMNNCPYRVRRFNWYEYSNNDKFDYNMNSDLGKMVLNPDVVVRTRGVVEKCSFCIQRIQEKKLDAKKENRELKDGEIKPACLQSCPADAIVFGDLNMSESAVSKAYSDERNYFLLEQVNTRPSVGYLTKVRNTKS